MKNSNGELVRGPFTFALFTIELCTKTMYISLKKINIKLTIISFYYDTWLLEVTARNIFVKNSCVNSLK